ncbi:MAG: VTT domain-containing protein [bacterium]|nr:VTT domain-containing protein [bacterium]
MYFLGIDLVALIKAAGYLGLFGIVFAESGLFIGFFLPGDSLLFTAGFLASQSFLNIWILAPLTFIAAILGDNFGYAFGRRVGPAIFTRERSLFFHKEYLERARIFYEAHGGKAIVLARFLPVIRTFAPILAGAGRMHYPTFLFYNVIGAALWAIGLTFLGFYLGNAIPGIDRYLVPIVLVIVIISSLPTLWHLVRHREIFQR